MPQTKQSGAMLIMFLFTDVRKRAIAELFLNDTAKCCPFESQAKLCGWPPISSRADVWILDRSAIGRACFAKEAAEKDWDYEKIFNRSEKQTYWQTIAVQ